MDKNVHYQLALKTGGIWSDDAVKYIESLRDETLSKIGRLDFDRRLIKPILEIAEKDVAVNPEMELDEAVNNILNNKRRMMSFMVRFCL